MSLVPKTPKTNHTFNSKQVYFGSSEVRLCKVENATVYNFDEWDFYHDGNLDEIDSPQDQNSKSTLFRMENEVMFECVLPEVPGRHVKIRERNSFGPRSGSMVDAYVKHSEGEHVGVRSGVRSALLQVDGEWYRFKGCGNNYDGFKIRLIGNGLEEIRGCCFQQTARRELLFFSKINELLEKKGWPLSNIPVGYWRYPMMEIDEKYPNVERCCVVYRTFAEKRLGDHVIGGLELLYPIIFGNTDFTSLATMFDDLRDITSSKEVVISGYAAQCEMKLVDGRSIGLIPDWGRLDDYSASIDAKWKDVWKQNVLILKSNYGKKLIPLFMWIIGREIGEVQRLLHDNEILWGTYSDRLAPLHCNAHPNNLIILPEVRNGRWLAPLDFDMAFERKEFKFGDKKFQELRVAEFAGMQCALGGVNLNTGSRAMVDLETTSLRIIQNILRDTLVLGFQAGYNSIPNDVKFESFQVGSRALITLCLILTDSLVA